MRAPAQPRRPARAAVADARRAVGGPGVDVDALADVEVDVAVARRGVRRPARASAVPVPERGRAAADDRRDDELRRRCRRRSARRRAPAARPSAEHQQIERAGGELGRDREAGRHPPARSQADPSSIGATPRRQTAGARSVATRRQRDGPTLRAFRSASPRGPPMLRFQFPHRHHRRGLPLRERLGPGHPRARRRRSRKRASRCWASPATATSRSSRSSKAAPAPSSCRSTTRSSPPGPELDPAVLNLRKFISEIRRKNAEIPIYLYGETRTSQHLPNDILRELHGFIHMFEDTPEFVARHIIREARSYLDGVAPPFFKALVDYAQDGSYSWHCPGHSGGVAFLKSPVGQMFHQFFGENMLRADVCNSVDELGQLLDHTGPVAASERNAARIFNADHCFFVTNGTSTSNKMVWHHTVAPGDVVVVDRNCHKSILHAIIMTGAIPVFLTPTRNHYGIIGPIPQCGVHARGDPRARSPPTRCWPASTPTKVKPRILTLTQSTYDGVLYNTETIKHALDGYIDTLHFDEAWLPHAAFHNFYGAFHAMGKKRARPKKPARLRDAVDAQAAGRHQPGVAGAGAGRADAEARPAPLQRGLPDAQLDEPAVRDHRVVRRLGGDDGGARRHGAGRGEHRRVARLPPRDAQGRRRVRQGLVVQGLGPGKARRRGHRHERDDWMLKANAKWHGFGDLADGLQPARPDQVHDRSRPASTCRASSPRPAFRRRSSPSTWSSTASSSRRPACTRSSSCSRSASPRAAGTRCSPRCSSSRTTTTATSRCGR